MKVSYIILPFTDSTYLVRCVNSLYRQLGEDFEVILAENDFGQRQEEIEEFLESKPQVLRISKFESTNQENMSKMTAVEKLEKAISLISDDSGFVMLLDVNTVTAPICTKEILKYGQSDLILPAAAIKQGDEFIADRLDKSALQKKFDEYMPQRFCYGKKLFSRFKTEFIENNELFSAFLFTELAEGIEVAATEDIVVYASSFFASETSESTDFNTVKEQCDVIFSKLLNIKDAEVQIVVLDKVIKRISAFLTDEAVEIRSQSFEVLKGYYRFVSEDFLLQKYIESAVGFDTDKILEMDYGQFAAYKSYIRGDSNPITEVDCAVQNKLLSDMKTVLSSVKQEMSDMKKDIAAIKIKSASFNIAAPAVIGTVISDPYTDIPKMYREGRLGFKTIWRSFWSWFKFKLGRKM